MESLRTRAPDLEAFTQTVPGTAISFDMMPVETEWIAVVRPNDRFSEPQLGRAPFWIAKTEMTWDLYDTFVFGLDQSGAPDESGVDAITRPSKPYIAMDRGFGKSGYPVISVSYHGATMFCEWLSKKTGRTYRLPTAAEWVLACGVGGTDLDPVDDYAWYKSNATYTTHPVGTKKPDALGLHDMYGNASEWCTGADDEPVTMGGSYRDSAKEIGCTRSVASSDEWNASDPQIPKSVWWLADGGFVGFRIVCIPQEDEGASNEERQ
ncbi:MAG: SUMF1/EgtB/PvdO family nonheme iron enzyme [Planctomycetes bacterium]|nr:SUMF1/EgtB/PvdO family nonheme iron enzyme [Planctomycetota bacterium]